MQKALSRQKKELEKATVILQDKVYIIDIGVSCCGNIELPKRPKRKDDETDEHLRFHLAARVASK